MARRRTATNVEQFELRVRDHRLVVLSVADDVEERVEGLTAAERAVALEAIAGRSNRAIALARGSTPRTVANQLAAVYRKLRVSSRAQLAARLTGHAKTS